MVSPGVEAFAFACSNIPRAMALLGDAPPDDVAQLRDVATRLAEEHGVAMEFSQLAGELIAEGAPGAAARIAAYWAARRLYGVDPRVERELAGVSPDDLLTQRVELEADAEEQETRRFYREDFPAIAAARGQRVEDSPGWRHYVGDDVPAPAAPTAPVAQVPDLGPASDWPEDAIRNDYRRHMSAAERRIFNAELERVVQIVGSPQAAAPYAMHRVIERRVRGNAA
jgi:hypothetical protein